MSYNKLTAHERYQIYALMNVLRQDTHVDVA